MTQVDRLQRQNKKFMVIIRPGFKKICADDACRAGMFNHILYNIAKQKQAGSDYWFSTGDAIWEETDRSWGKSKTLKEIKDLETTGIVARMRNPHNSWDQTRYYSFGEEQAKALHELCVKNEICLASMRLPIVVTHLLQSTNAFCKNKKCICCNQQIDMLNLANPFVETEIFPDDESASQADSETLFKDSTQDSTQDSFLGVRKFDPITEEQPPLKEKKLDAPLSTETSVSLSYSQKSQKDVLPSVAWLQEDQETNKNTPSQVPIVVTQVAPPIAEPAMLIPPEPKPANKYNIPANLSMKPDMPDMKTSPELSAKQRKNRMQEIIVLADAAVGARVPRSPKKFVGEALDDLVDGDYSDDQIIFSIKDLKARNRDLNYQEIAKNMANAVVKIGNKLQPGNVLAFPQAQPPTKTTPGQRVLDELRAKHKRFSAPDEERIAQ